MRKFCLIMFAELREDGCEFGRFIKKDVKDVKKDMNGVEKKVGKMYKLGWAILLSLIGTLFSVIYLLIK